MEKTKYRYKCMICGTEVVSSDDVLSCSACGSDELAKFEITPVIDIVEKTPKKLSRRRKSVMSSSRCADIYDTPYLFGSLRPLDPAPPMPEPIPSIISRSPAPPPSSIPPYVPPRHITPPPPPSPPPTMMKRIAGRLKCIAGKALWKNLFKIAATLTIGSVIYGVVRLFI